MPRQTRRAVATNPTKPLNTNTVANLQVIVLTARSHLDDLAYTLVAANLVGLRGVWQSSPTVGHNAQIRMADSGVSAFDFIGKPRDNRVGYCWVTLTG